MVYEKQKAAEQDLINYRSQALEPSGINRRDEMWTCLSIFPPLLIVI